MPAIIISIKPVIEGVLTCGDTRYTNPAKAITTPIHSVRCSLLPKKSESNIIVTCTEPNKMSAPVPVSSVRNANENEEAYKNNIAALNQLPFEDDFFPLFLICKIKKSTIAPESNLTEVKFAAPIVFSPSANRHSTEFEAKAINAKTVKNIVFNNTRSDLSDKIVLRQKH